LTRERATGVWLVSEPVSLCFIALTNWGAESAAGEGKDNRGDGEAHFGWLCEILGVIREYQEGITGVALLARAKERLVKE